MGGLVAKTHEAGAAPERVRASRVTPPKDRFDGLAKSGRVGAHRIVGRPRRFWIYTVVALLGVALLTGLGIAMIHVMGANLDNLTNEEPTPTKAPPEAATKLDPEAEVAVINGTSSPGFGAVVDGLITENGWGQILFSTEGETSDVQNSAIFYANREDEAAALGLAEELGGVAVFQNDGYFQQFGAKLTVLLGADYSGPGSGQMVAVEPDPEVEGPGADE